MIFDSKKHKIFFYDKPIDLRKGHSSLARLVTSETKFELMEGMLFLFVSRNRKTLKGLFFDGSGLVILHKKLDSGKFMSTNFLVSPLELYEDDFKIIFHGGEIPLTSKGQRIRLQSA
jgi:transposase